MPSDLREIWDIVDGEHAGGIVHKDTARFVIDRLAQLEAKLAEAEQRIAEVTTSQIYGRGKTARAAIDAARKAVARKGKKP